MIKCEKSCPNRSNRTKIKLKTNVEKNPVKYGLYECQGFLFQKLGSDCKSPVYPCSALIRPSTLPRAFGQTFSLLHFSQFGRSAK